MVSESRRELYLWIGAGLFALSAGAVLAFGSGTAHADSAGTGSSGAAHHQKHSAGPASRSTGVTVTTLPTAGSKPKSRSAVAGVRANVVGDTSLTEQDSEIAAQHKAIEEQAKTFSHEARLAVFDFTSVSPEVNSNRLYSGAGSRCFCRRRRPGTDSPTN
ncbi:hypothetical protein Y900_007345 [Mycolicibacterium aromaticivorans JS19b1 = JCM 16368]|uniref:Uncharacterized protein n=1 Tax=Mycolicibacterium aromaticivorans JS19b1 = JCM 16368 TaxID=1440774 RepID=A0A064CDQ0_9MYCO|nr:hypothetical protein [Mycolicibacterium aromaticivorans]KDE98764.1 hypothetical protein Y900_007345 [Mycolicibacterium aromaticivorans JS19b1 = JCM 16368]